MKKLFFSLFAATFLTGCVQSTAMIGPAMTLVSTGNTAQAFGTFLTNKAKQLIILLQNNIRNTRKELNLN